MIFVFFDVGLTLVLRLFRGENIFLPHREHIYQRIQQAGWSHSSVSLFHAALSVLACILAIPTLLSGNTATTYPAHVFWVVLIALYALLPLWLKRRAEQEAVALHEDRPAQPLSTTRRSGHHSVAGGSSSTTCAQAGHQVITVAPHPHYPYPDRDRFFSSGVGRGRRRVDVRLGGTWDTGVDGERILRVPYLHSGSSMARQMLDQAVSAAGAMSAVIDRLRGRMRPDVVISTTPALPFLLAGDTLSRLLKVPHVAEVRDAWPDLISEMSLVTGALGQVSAEYDYQHNRTSTAAGPVHPRATPCRSRRRHHRRFPATPRAAGSDRRGGAQRSLTGRTRRRLGADGHRCSSGHRPVRGEPQRICSPRRWRETDMDSTCSTSAPSVDPRTSAPRSVPWPARKESVYASSATASTRKPSRPWRLKRTPRRILRPACRGGTRRPLEMGRCRTRQSQLHSNPTNTRSRRSSTHSWPGRFRSSGLLPAKPADIITSTSAGMVASPGDIDSVAAAMTKMRQRIEAEADVRHR